MRARLVVLSLSVACAPANAIPSPGQCAADPIAAPTAVPIALAGKAAPFDDVHFAPLLGRVLASPPGTGALYLVDPTDDSVVSFAGLPPKATSADATATHVYVGDRGGARVLVLDASDGSIVGTLALSAEPDYVRVTPDGGELWVTMPAEDRIAVHTLDDAGLPTEVGSVAIDGGPEGLTFAPSGARAYAHLFDGRLAAIDVIARARIAVWETGCAGAHGFPQVDEERALVFAGCRSDGAAVVLDADDGTRLAGFESGGGEAILAYGSGHFYLRGDPGGDLAILAVCDDGDLHELARVAISDRGHGMTADERGNVWICDEASGGLLKVAVP